MILKHRDKELLQFEWVGPLGVCIVSVNEKNRFHPLGSYDEHSELPGVSRHTDASRIKTLVAGGQISCEGAPKNGRWRVIGGEE